MSFDISRLTFNPWSDYSGVVMEQGRVQTDADWNEWLAENARRVQAETLDIMGRAVYPATTPYAFQITATTSSGTNSISIGCGRMYVDGLLAENHGRGPQEAGDAPWDPALAEFSGSPQPPLASNSNPIDYTQQPYYPNPRAISGNGPFLAYLDVWQRPVTYLQDANLIDSAIGVDTTGRIQTVWQVKLMTVPAGTTCTTPDSEITYPPASSAGLLTTNVVENPVSGPCCLTADTGYTGLENQCYRVEIHNPGTSADPANPSGATFKWSRENASVETGVTSIALGSNSLGKPASVLTVQSLGRDQVLGFLPGNWIEITDEAHQLNGIPGETHQIDSIDPSNSTITLTTTTSSAFPVGTPNAANCTRIIRWDQSGKVYEKDLTTVWCDLGAAGGDGTIPVPLSNTTLILENGITVTFGLSSSGGSFNTGDFWSFAARTDGTLDSPLTDSPPFGPHHHYAKLAIVSFSPLSYPDCRTEWPPSVEASCGCCTCTVGEGGQYTSIQAAINALPTNGGEVCILPGHYYEEVMVKDRTDVVIRGCGRQTIVASPSLKPGGSEGSSEPSLVKSKLRAVITLIGSQHVTLTSFCVEAGDKRVGILLDKNAADDRFGASDADVTIEQLEITASTLPAIAALNAETLTIDENRIAMKDVWSAFPAVYVSGREIHVDRNLVGLKTIDRKDPATDDLAALKADFTRASGGIQIGGPSQDVYVIENEIEGGGQNGITLGNVTTLDENGAEVPGLSGTVFVDQTDCTTTHTIEISGSAGSGSNALSRVAGGPLVNIQIVRNRIRDMGLCGIGPVGFFDLEKTAEAIGIENLTITRNEITRTVSQAFEKAPIGETAAFGYAAISLPDVVGLTIEDNAITDFGPKPGAEVCGIFILRGELVDISRNQIRETRDWSLAPSDAEGGSSYPLRGGIVIASVTPPTFTSTESNVGNFNAFAVPIHEPGLPALRVEHNVVRVALGDALEAFGFGPFSIVNNNLSTGGTVALRDKPPAMTVEIINLGIALELTSLIVDFVELYKGTKLAPDTIAKIAAASDGAVLFTNNVCQLEARVDGQLGATSVMILSLDHILFANNACWIDSNPGNATLPGCAMLDALLLAVTLQVCNNRFQEALASVLASGLTAGFLNVTSQNLSTYCLFAVPKMLPGALNVSWVSAQLCEEFQKRLGAGV
jgi:hypothetical protein